MGIGSRELQHCNTATASAESELASAMPSASSLDEVNTATKCANLIRKKNQKKISKTFVNRNGNVVTLHSELKAYPAPPKGREVSPL